MGKFSINQPTHCFNGDVNLKFRLNDSQGKNTSQIYKNYERSLENGMTRQQFFRQLQGEFAIYGIGPVDTPDVAVRMQEYRLRGTPEYLEAAQDNTRRAITARKVEASREYDQLSVFKRISADGRRLKAEIQKLEVICGLIDYASFDVNPEAPEEIDWDILNPDTVHVVTELEPRAEVVRQRAPVIRHHVAEVITTQPRAQASAITRSPSEVSLAPSLSDEIDPEAGLPIGGLALARLRINDDPPAFEAEEDSPPAYDRGNITLEEILRAAPPDYFEETGARRSDAPLTIQEIRAQVRAQRGEGTGDTFTDVFTRLRQASAAALAEPVVRPQAAPLTFAPYQADPTRRQQNTVVPPRDVSELPPAVEPRREVVSPEELERRVNANQAEIDRVRAADREFRRMRENQALDRRIREMERESQQPAPLDWGQRRGYWD